MKQNVEMVMSDEYTNPHKNVLVSFLFCHPDKYFHFQNICYCLFLTFLSNTTKACADEIL